MWTRAGWPTWRSSHAATAVMPSAWATSQLCSPAHLRAYTSARLLAAIARGFVLGTAPLRAYLRLNLGEHRFPAKAAFLATPQAASPDRSA